MQIFFQGHRDPDFHRRRGALRAYAHAAQDEPFKGQGGSPP